MTNKLKQQLLNQNLFKKAAMNNNSQGKNTKLCDIFNASHAFMYRIISSFMTYSNFYHITRKHNNQQFTVINKE